MLSSPVTVVPDYGRNGSPPPLQSGRAVGAILVEAGKLTTEEVDRILDAQNQYGIRFGQAALKLGLARRQDIQHALSLQFDYPYLQPSETIVSRRLVTAYVPFDPRVDKLRELRSWLQLRWFGAQAARPSLAVVSPQRDEGRSFIAANLAVLFSQLGERTLIIDADLRNPRQHAYFHLDNRVGLSAVLAGRIGMEAVRSIPVLRNLSVLPAGAVPPNPHELVARSGFDQLLARLGEKFDVILLDTPAGTEWSDAQTIAARAGGALMVGRKDRSHLRQMRAFGDKLVGSGTTLVGAVMNEI